MADSKLKQDIKKILTGGHQLWLHESDLNLAVEDLHTLFDIERIRAIEAARQDFTESRIDREGLQE